MQLQARERLGDAESKTSRLAASSLLIPSSSPSDSFNPDAGLPICNTDASEQPCTSAAGTQLSVCGNDRASSLSVVVVGSGSSGLGGPRGSNVWLGETTRPETRGRIRVFVKSEIDQKAWWKVAGHFSRIVRSCLLCCVCLGWSRGAFRKPPSRP